jgi:hypothetical protein
MLLVVVVILSLERALKKGGKEWTLSGYSRKKTQSHYKQMSLTFTVAVMRCYGALLIF